MQSEDDDESGQSAESGDEDAPAIDDDAFDAVEGEDLLAQAQFQANEAQQAAHAQHSADVAAGLQAGTATGRPVTRYLRLADLPDEIAMIVLLHMSVARGDRWMHRAICQSTERGTEAAVAEYDAGGGPVYTVALKELRRQVLQLIEAVDGTPLRDGHRNMVPWLVFRRHRHQVSERALTLQAPASTSQAVNEPLIPLWFLRAEQRLVADLQFARSLVGRPGVELHAYFCERVPDSMLRILFGNTVNSLTWLAKNYELRGPLWDQNHITSVFGPHTHPDGSLRAFPLEDNLVLTMNPPTEFELCERVERIEFFNEVGDEVNLPTPLHVRTVYLNRTTQHGGRVFMSAGDSKHPHLLRDFGATLVRLSSVSI